MFVRMRGIRRWRAMISTCSPSAPARAASPLAVAPAAMARASRSVKRAGSAAPACIRGCVPKKLLVYGAQFADAFEDAAGFGWDAHVAEFDWAELIAAKDREIDRLNQIYISMLEKAGVETCSKAAAADRPHTVEVAGRAYTAENHPDRDRRPSRRAQHPGHRARHLSNEALDLPELPRRIVIVGGGYIAVEFAGIFSGSASRSR